MEAVEVEVAGVTAVSAKNKFGGTERQKNNKIQVSNTKKPLYFYVNLAKRYMQQHEEVELSALGMAITTVVTIAEILKNNGLASQKKIVTSTVGMKDLTNGRLIQKAKIEIIMAKTESSDNMLTATTTVSEVAAEILLTKTESSDNMLTATTVPEVAADGKEE